MFFKFWLTFDSMTTPVLYTSHNTLVTYF